MNGVGVLNVFIIGIKDNAAMTATSNRETGRDCNLVFRFSCSRS